MKRHTVQFCAPAKVNLCLEIGGKTQEGYHRMRMICQTVSLCDTVVLTTTSGRETRVFCKGMTLPQDNTCRRAADFFFKQTGLQNPGLEITIEKTIPSEAGLGGASSDAAAVLRGLEKLYQRPLSPEQLRESAFAVGADVPFCYTGGTALVEGIGEQVSSLPSLTDCFFAIIKPGRGCSTREMFARWDSEKPEKTFSVDGVLDALREGDLRGAAQRIGNDFFPLSHRVVGSICRELMAWDALGAGMTGSGSAVVGIFSEEEMARRAAQSDFFTAMERFVARPVRGGPWELPFGKGLE